MFPRYPRIVTWLLGTVLLAALLSACGGGSAGGGPAPTATPVPIPPEERVKSFFDTFSQAINDPEISDPARQTEWVEQLAAYAAPAERDAVKEELTASLAEFTGMDLGALTGQPDLDARIEITFNITETRMVSETADQAIVEVVDGIVSMKPVGADVAQLGEMAAMMTQDLPISDFFADTGNEDRQIELVKVDGVWYLVNALSSVGS
ncbi:MAG: hypothetical protein AB4911_22395 [Oscillochloridaceae bacterium umkhey_bin13]